MKRSLFPGVYVHLHATLKNKDKSCIAIALQLAQPVSEVKLVYFCLQ